MEGEEPFSNRGVRTSCQSPPAGDVPQLLSAAAGLSSHLCRMHESEQAYMLDLPGAWATLTAASSKHAEFV